MSRMGYKGLLTSTALIAVVVVVSDGCSGDNGNNNGDAMSDAGVEEAMHPPVRHDAGGTDEGGGEAGGDGSTSGGEAGNGSYDGTTGKLCSKNTDCAGANGPGLNVCSNNAFQEGAIDPTPICISATPCDLGDGSQILFCDGPSSTDGTSPGICLPTPNATSGPNGQCLPKCTIPSDGSEPQGCQGKDRCNMLVPATQTATGNLIGLGFCFGGCAADSDCPSGVCQKDEGICVTTLKTATKQLGQVCTANDVTSTSRYGCNCFFQTMSMLGYCSQFCITGPSSPAPCPSGYVCDPELPAQVIGINDATMTGFTKTNPGLVGYCLQTCSTTPGGNVGNDASTTTDAMVGDGAAQDAGSAPAPDAQAGTMCPITAGCSTQYASGPDCVP